MENSELLKYSDVLKDLGKTQHVATVIAPMEDTDCWEMRIEFRRGSKTDSHLDKVYEVLTFKNARGARRAEEYFWDDEKVDLKDELDTFIGVVLSDDELAEAEEETEEA